MMLNHALQRFVGSQARRAWEPVFTTPIEGKTAVIAGAGADGFVDLGFGGVRVSQRNMDARARQSGDELGAAGPFGGDGDEADATVGGGLEAREFGERRSVHRCGGVGAAVAGLGT